MLQSYNPLNSPISRLEEKFKTKLHKINSKLYTTKVGDLVIFDEGNIVYIPKDSNSEGNIIGTKFNESFRIRHFGGGVTNYNTDEILKKRLEAFLKIPYNTQGALNLFILHGAAGMGKTESAEQFIEEILGKSPSSVLPGLSGVTKKMYEDNVKLRDEYDEFLSDDEQKARKLQWDELSIDEQRKVRRNWQKLTDDQKEDSRMSMPVPSSMKQTFDQYTTLDKVQHINAGRAGSVFNGSAIRSAGDFYIQLYKTMNCTIILDDKVSAFINGDTFIREMLLNACQTNYKKRLVEYTAAETASGRYEETPYALYVKSAEIYLPKVTLYTGKIMMLTNYDLSKDEALSSRAQFFDYSPEKGEVANKIDAVIARNIKESPQYEAEFRRIEKFVKSYLGIDTGKLKNFDKYNHRIISKMFQLAIAHKDETEFNHMATIEMKKLLGG